MSSVSCDFYAPRPLTAKHRRTLVHALRLNALKRSTLSLKIRAYSNSNSRIVLNHTVSVSLVETVASSTKKTKRKNGQKTNVAGQLRWFQLRILLDRDHGRLIRSPLFYEVFVTARGEVIFCSLMHERSCFCRSSISVNHRQLCCAQAKVCASLPAGRSAGWFSKKKKHSRECAAKVRHLCVCPTACHKCSRLHQ